MFGDPQPSLPPGALAVQFGLMLGLALVSLAFSGSLLYTAYFLLTLPMRRNERARLFLHLLDLGLKEGRTPEAAIVDAARSRDGSLGVRFHLLAAELEKGARLGEALDRVPRLLPPAVRGMLKSGAHAGDISRVLPACRRLLRDGVSQTRGALNYLLLLALAVTPIGIGIPIVVSIFIVPKLREILSGEGGNLPPFSAFVFGENHLFSGLQFVLFSLIWLAVFMYVGGPAFTSFVRRILPGVPDWIHFQLPWRRRRLQRDFSATLATLLDAGAPESDAVSWAADATANAVIRRRGAAICAQLKNGVALPAALHSLDGSGELQWRIANALRRGRGFLNALAGWHEALDAKAFQLEQSAAQIATSLLVLVNGLLVSCIVIAVFLALISLINQAALW
jgi:type II secretory pathway component PulF